MIGLEQAEESYAAMPMGSSMPSHGGRGGSAGAVVSRWPQEVVHHHPPKDMASDVGYPARGGQTLLIAYFPWEASEADIEREFAKVSRVKRVHLVVDKASKKPRCFGFVKFMTKVDAEEALHATTQGLVQLPDTRGHVWHLKAEWTKSGDMVVDDSETEQEVAKRKEERRTRADQRSGGSTLAVMEAPSRTPPPQGGKWPAATAKGALHPGIPAPLPPLQQQRRRRRWQQQEQYPTMPAPLGLQSQAPVLHPSQNHLGILGGGGTPIPQLSHGGHVQQMLPAQQPLPQSQSLTQQMYQGQQGQQMYSAVPPSLPLYGGPGSGVAQIPPRDNGAASQLQGRTIVSPQDALGSTGGGLPLPREGLNSSQGYSSTLQGYTTGQHGYPSGQQGCGTPAGYVPQPQGFVAGQQGQQLFAAGQQGYSTGAQQAYPPPQHSGFPPQGQAYAAQQQGTKYNPGYPSQAYASYNLGQGIAQHGAFGYLQPPSAGAAAPGILAYGNYPGSSNSGTPLQSQVVVHQGDEGGQESATVTIAGVPHVVVSPAVQPPYIHTSQHIQPPAPNTSVGGPSAPEQMTMSEAVAGVPLSMHTGIANNPSSTSTPQPANTGSDTQHLDMLWQLSEMSLREKNSTATTQSLPAPPSQQPPAPPARYRDWEAVAQSGVVPGFSAGSGPAAVWNSFDDAAAKGMVDGLVGREDGVPPLVTWSTHAA